MNNSIRHAAGCLFVAVTTYALPAFAQYNVDNVEPATPDAAALNDDGAGLPAPAGRRATNRPGEQQPPGAPAEYGGGDTPQGDTGEAQRAAPLGQQRVTVTNGGAGARRARDDAKRKTPATDNGQMRVAGQPGPAGPTAAEARPLQGAPKNVYADPYDAGKHPIYRSPW
ncbi:hypothetical protein LJ655_05010 [Paraburkholderia sp. MMS20-SJTN17]|uniref:DUF2782 domain-containing protein n=1 Tax=Paraburkholderia translucens TaxID=2886945 RepID=A0ABS8K943_9BURK|nr:hypothetical protein [Paraburkholderia sp. MMS20-SJTN17]MCC8401261.1 hypothetical protein [Paraburkholderia sp. MMS20-SJTN17]